MTKETWKTILKLISAVIAAIAGTLGVNACI